MTLNVRVATFARIIAVASSVSVLQGCVLTTTGSTIGRKLGPLASQDSVAVIEFRDDGFTLVPGQAQAALSFVDSTVESVVAMNARNNATNRRVRRSVLVLTYTHGWHHTADTTRGDFVKFRQFVRELRRDVSVAFSRDTANVRDSVSIVPIYFAWRGERLHGFKTEYLTFFDRKHVAEKIGSGEYSVVVSALSARRRRWADDSLRNRNTLVLAGHSFGAAALLTATAPAIARAIADTSQALPSTSQPADLVVAINPAIEANVLERTVLSKLTASADSARAVRTQSRVARVMAQSVFAPMRPATGDLLKAAYATAPTRLLVMDAANDRPRSFWFPFGRTLGALPKFTIAATSTIAVLALPRRIRFAAIAPVAVVADYTRRHSWDLKRGETHAAGRFEGQRTIDVVRVPSLKAEGRCPALDVPLTSRLGEGERVPSEWIELVPRTSDACTRQVKLLELPKQILNGHSGFWTEENRALLRVLFLANIRASQRRGEFREALQRAGIY